MLTNLIIWLVVLILAVGAGWLTWRAVRAQRMWVKIAGGLGAGLLTIVLAALTFFGGKGIAVTYFPSVPAPPALTVAGTPEQIARGDYLVNLSCIGCHSSVGADGNPTEAHPLNGGWNISQAEGFGFVGDMVADNLTPGGKLAGYTDGELFRVLRHRVDKEGDLLAFMSLLPTAQLSDDDVQSIIAYLRTLPPVEQTAVTGDKLSFVGAIMFGAGMFGASEKGAESVVAPAQGVSAEYGKYVATYGECRGCHGSDAAGAPASAMGPAVPNPRPLVGTLNLDQFKEMMRTGVMPDGVAFPDTMPWQIASRLTEDDLAALYAYLTTEP
ncbi:MAG: c-type cytochrome [Caldilineaceae bacterium]|nr:c-type cytochrome [Caldilineaceae bacterium]HRJ42201.1 c-type cytochrome [Caldilineaceae bacterium]